MEFKWIIITGSMASVLVLTLVILKHFQKRSCEHRQAQKLLDEYLKSNLSLLEIGTFYERYIGYLYEQRGYHVKYNGVINGVDDLGRDLIISSDNEILIVQTKCWSKHKTINEKYIFQLYGSMIHFKKSENTNGKKVRAVFYTTAKYSDVAMEVASDLGVELYIEELNRSYPLIKCNVNQRGEKIYHLPFDPYYDKIRIDLSEEKFYVHTVVEALSRGFRRAKSRSDEVA